MACELNLFDVLTGESSGGVIVYDFYDSNEDGLPDNGGSSLFIGNDGTVDFNGAVPGDYYFTHTVGEGACEVSVQFFVRVLPQVDAGIGDTINACQGDAAINLFSILNGTPDLTGNWSGAGTNSPDYDEGDPDDPTDDTFNPVTEGVYPFIYTVNQIAPNGYQLSDCENCLPKFSIVTINVTACGNEVDCDTGLSNLVQVCSVSGCQFSLFVQLVGTPVTGGTWTLLAGAPQVIVINDGYIGTVNFLGAVTGFYNFEYSLPDCNNTSLVTVQVVAQPWAGNDLTLTLCETMGNTNIFNLIGGSPNIGGTFSISPALPNGTFTLNGIINPAPGDAGVYTVIYTVENPTNGPCVGNCIDTQTTTITIVATCNAGVSGTGVVCDDDSLVLSAATLLGATGGGVWQVIGNSDTCNGTYTSTTFNVNGVPHFFPDNNFFITDGATIDNFTELGCIKFVYFCNQGTPCLEMKNFILTVITCAPACTASVTISAVACALSSIITGTCPSPVYQWQRFNGTTWIAAPVPNNLSTYAGVHNNQYRLRVTNCTSCDPIYSNEIIVSCPPNACVITGDSFVYNTAQQRLEGQWTHNNGDGNGTSVQYFFNKCTTAASPCSSCGGWGVNQGGGTGNNATIATFNVAQTSVAQCWRIVIQDLPVPNPLCQVIMYVTIPAISTLHCYELVDMQPFTDIKQVVVDVGAGNVNIMTQPQFGCTDYESTEPTGAVNATINCSYAQLVIDINQWLSANGFSGTATVRQQAKSSTIRIKDTNVIFKHIVSELYDIKDFQQFASGCQLCDAMPIYHFQGVGAVENFPSIGYLNPSVAGTINLFDLLDQYHEEIPLTGTFTAAICNVATTGCVSINTNCWNDCAPPPATPVTVVNNIGFSDHGDVNWIVFTPAVAPICFWNFRYLVTLANGCEECFHIILKWDDNL